MTSASDSARSGKPRLWVLTTTFPRWRGDAEPPFVFELSRRLTAAFDVTVLTPRAPGAAEREQMDGVTVVRYAYCTRSLEQLAYGGGILGNIRQRPWRIALVPFMLFGLWRTLRKAIRHEHVDVIHAHWLFPQGWIAALAARRVPVIVTAHGADVFALRGWLWDCMRRWVVDRSFAVTAVSASMADEIRRAAPARQTIEIIPMGVDLSHMFVPDHRGRRDGLLFVGRLVPKKGVESLLRALASLSERGRKLHLVIAGDGPELQRLRSLCVELRLAAHVSWQGAVLNAQLPHLYCQANALVAPFTVAPDGDREGLGLVIVEAMGCECPVVTTDLARVNPVVNEQTAWITPPGEVEALANAICSVLDHSSEAEARAARAREAVLTSFDWQSISQRYARLLRTAAQR